MHDFYYLLYLGRLFIHLNEIIQVSQHSSIFFLYLSITMLTSAFKYLRDARFVLKHIPTILDLKLSKEKSSIYKYNKTMSQSNLY